MAGKTAPPATNPRNAAPTRSRAHAEAFSGRPSDSSTSTAPTKDTVVTVATWSGLGGGGSASPDRSSSESAGPSVTMHSSTIAPAPISTSSHRIDCVTRAHPDASTFVPGRVTVRFRIQRTGAVKGIQVEAPVILHKGGLTGCIKGVVGGLRFPASNMSQVITYPFSLL